MYQQPHKQIETRRQSQTLALAACLTLLGGSAGAQATATKTDTAIQVGAIEALRRMGTYLRSLKRFSVDASTQRDEVTRNGEKIQIGGTVAYQVRVPNGLRAEIKTDRKQRQILYDGKTLTVYAPRMHFYASVPAPSTIGQMLDSASKRFDIDFPLADLFLWGTPKDGVKELTSARWIGPAFVDGVDTDQFAYRQDGTDWQLWIQRGNPLPKKIVIITTSNPAMPEYNATLKWNLTPTFGDAVFSFAPPAGAERIVLASIAGRSEREPARK